MNFFWYVDGNSHQGKNDMKLHDEIAALSPVFVCRVS
jgi:hypothetical protein